MGNKNTIAGIVFGIVGLVSSIALFFIFTDINNQRQQELNNNLLEAKQELDAAIRHDVTQCLASPSTYCDNYLLQAEDTCKGETGKDVPACHDGTISIYFSIRGVGSNNTPYVATNSSDQNQLSTENIIDNCV